MYLKAISNKSGLILIRSSDTTSWSTGLVPLLLPWQLFTKTKSLKNFVNFICFQKSVRRVIAPIFLSTLYSVNESLSGLSSPMDLKDESVSERCKKFFMVKKNGKFYFFSKFLFLKICISNLNSGKPPILQEFSFF